MLRRLLSEDRLRPYLDAVGGDWNPALQLYEWNICVGSAAMGLTGMVEVFLRNAFDQSLLHWARGKGEEDWLGLAPLDQRGREDINKARRRAGDRATHGSVLAELTFGFCRYLVGRKYLTTLWIPALSRAFPYVDGDSASARALVEASVQQLHFLRNRAAHNEPVHRRDLHGDLLAAQRLIGWIDPAAATWMLRQEGLSAILRERPQPR